MNNDPAVGDGQINDFLHRTQWGNTPTMSGLGATIEHLNMLGFDARLPSPPDMEMVRGDLIRLWVGLKVLVDRKAHEICTGRDGAGQPVSANSGETLALHKYTMDVRTRLCQIAGRESHGGEAIELANLTVREWHIDQCTEYVAQYGLDEDLEPPDERYTNNQAMGAPASYRRQGRRRDSRIPSGLLP